MNHNQKSPRMLYLAAGTIALIFAGVVYAWSIFKAPLAVEFGWSASALSLNFTIVMCCFCFGGMLGGALIKRLSYFQTCLISAALAISGFVLASFTRGSLLDVYLGYGVLGGLGIGITYTGTVSVVGSFFPDKKGLCTGILMMGFGSSSLVIGGVADAIILNPLMGWRMAYRIVGLAMGVAVLAAGAIIKYRPIESGRKEAEECIYEQGLTPRQMLHSADFYKGFLFLVFLAGVGNTVISMARDIAMDTGISGGTASTLVGILSVFNGCSRIVTGIAFDRFGRKKTMLGSCVAAVSASVLVFLAAITGSRVICIAGLCLTGAAYGTCSVITPSLTSDLFGKQHFSGNFPIMNCNLVFASIIATIASIINTLFGGFIGSGFFLVLLAVSSLGLCLNIRK